MWLDPSQGRLHVEPRFAEQRRLDEVPRRPRAAGRAYEPQLHEPRGPWPQRGGLRELERARHLGGGQALGLAEQAQRDALALAELVALVGLGDESDDARVHHTPRDRHVHRVRALGDGRRGPPAGEQAVVHQVEAAALALHQLQVVEDAGEAVVPPAAGV